MMAGMIFVISILTLLQFFVSYSRSLIAESRGHELVRAGPRNLRPHGQDGGGRPIPAAVGTDCALPGIGRGRQYVACRVGIFSFAGLRAPIVRMDDSFRHSMDRDGTWRLRLRGRSGSGSPDCLQPHDHGATSKPSNLIQPRRIQLHMLSGKLTADCEIPAIVVTIINSGWLVAVATSLHPAKESAAKVSSDDQRAAQTRSRHHRPARHDWAGRPRGHWRFGRRGFGGDAPDFRRVADASRDRGFGFTFQPSVARNGSGRRRTLRESAGGGIPFGI